MPITATFVADFASFQNAVKNAEISLKGLDTGASKVGTSLNRMADSFSGRKLISDATQMAEVFERAGGVTSFTTAELARMSAVGGQALEKLKVMGADIPPQIQRMATETAKANDTWTQSISTLKGLAGALGVTFSVGAIVGFGRELLQLGDELVRTSDRTGLTISEVQRLSFIAGQSGNTLDELTSSIGQMQNRLASGDDSAVGALKKLNISFDELRAAGPYQQLELIAAAVDKIPNPATRAQVAMDLFGRSGIAILPTLTSNFKDLAQAAPEMGEATARALETAGDSLEKFKSTMTVLAAESFNVLGKVFDTMVAQAYEAVAQLLSVSAAVVGFAEKIPGASKLVGSLGLSMAGLTKEAQWFRDASAGMIDGADGVTKSIGRAIPAFDVAEKSVKKLGDAHVTIQKDLRETANWLGVEQQNAAGAAQVAWNKLEADTIKLSNAFKDLKTASDDGAVSFIRWIEPTQTLAGFFNDIGVEAKKMGPDIEKATGSMDDLGEGADESTDALESLADGMVQLAQVSGDSFDGIVQDVAKFVVSMNTAAKAGRDFQQATDASGKTAAGFSGAVAVMGAASEGGAKGVMSAAASGAAFGSAFGPWGTVIGGAAGAIAGLVHNLSDASEEVKRATAEFGIFQAQMASIATETQMVEAAGRSWALTNIVVRDAYIDVGLTGEEAMRDIQVALDATHHSADDVKEALARINMVLEEQQEQSEFLTKTIDKYGLSWEGAGKEARDARLAETTRGIQREFDALMDAGFDVNTVMRSMGTSINDMVAEARRSGTAVPESFRRIIQIAIDAGEVFDENGNKIGDMTELGLEFGESVADSMSDVAKSIEHLADVLSDDLSRAIRSTGSLVSSQERVWDGWGRNAISNIHDVDDELDGLNFGHSPGGLKEIPILLHAANSAFQDFGSLSSSALARADAQMRRLAAGKTFAAPSFSSFSSGSTRASTTSMSASAPASIDTSGLASVIQQMLVKQTFMVTNAFKEAVAEMPRRK